MCDLISAHHFAVVSEFFMVAPAHITAQSFFALQQMEQADLVWEHLFVRRLPISEAQIGVVTTLKELGLEEFARDKDLNGIRLWFKAQNPEQHVKVRMLGSVGVRKQTRTSTHAHAHQ